MCRGLPSVKTVDAKPVFRALFRRMGLPDAIRTDNGTPFASTGIHGLSGPQHAARHRLPANSLRALLGKINERSLLITAPAAANRVNRVVAWAVTYFFSNTITLLMVWPRALTPSKVIVIVFPSFVISRRTV